MKKIIFLIYKEDLNMIKKNKNKNMTEREKRIKEIKKSIKNGSYDLKTAIEGAAEKILEYPQSLLWR